MIGSGGSHLQKHIGESSIRLLEAQTICSRNHSGFAGQFADFDHEQDCQMGRL